MDATYALAFPDYSSLKVVRRGVLSCGAPGCTLTLKPIENASLGATAVAQK